MHCTAILTCWASWDEKAYYLIYNYLKNCKTYKYGVFGIKCSSFLHNFRLKHFLRRTFGMCTEVPYRWVTSSKILTVRKFLKKLPNINFYFNPFSISQTVNADRQADGHGRAKRCISFWNTNYKINNNLFQLH